MQVCTKLFPAISCSWKALVSIIFVWFAEMTESWSPPSMKLLFGGWDSETWVRKESWKRRVMTTMSTLGVLENFFFFLCLQSLRTIQQAQTKRSIGHVVMMIFEFHIYLITTWKRKFHGGPVRLILPRRWMMMLWANGEIRQKKFSITFSWNLKMNILCFLLITPLTWLHYSISL